MLPGAGLIGFIAFYLVPTVRGLYLSFTEYSLLGGYLPGLAMRRIADLHAGHAKTDPRDAFIIAQAARTLPHALESINIETESVAELSMLCGFDEDIVKQINQAANRLRGLLTQIHPALERVIGPRPDHPAVLDLLQHYPSPAALHTAGRARIGNQLVKRAPRIGRDLAEQINTALSEQKVIVAGSGAAALVIPRLAGQLATFRRQRAEIATEVEHLVEAHPLHTVLTSMPSVGVGTCARILTEVSGRTSTPPPTSPHTPGWPRSADARAPQSAASGPHIAVTGP